MALRALCTFALLAVLGAPAIGAVHSGDGKLDSALRVLAHTPRGTSRVLVITQSGAGDSVIRAAGGRPLRYLPQARAHVAVIDDRRIHRLASTPAVLSVHLDREVRSTMERTAAAIGARWVADNLGVDGAGIGVATIDSGISSWHDDLGADRLAQFVDFVNGQTAPYDDYGHGTHVAGIIAGSGRDSDGARRGIAPAAQLVVLKALDATGGGYISDVISAIDYAIASRAAYNIRVINLSVAAGVYESYLEDPLTLAARRAVDAGLVVVAAAGNLGRNVSGRSQYGAIAAPGNAPWVLTVGASSHMGTADRADDVVAAFSSRGPSAIDRAAKPDLVAPGVGIESTTEPSSALFAAYPASRLYGTADTISEPYLSLSGTSMAAPVVAATVALMLQANPALTPNAVKAILQYTAESKPDYDHLTQGAGFLNARGAVHLARRFAGTVDAAEAGDAGRWSRHIIWGESRVSGAHLPPSSPAWNRGVVWGASATPEGRQISWDRECDASADCPGDLRVQPLCDGADCGGDLLGRFDADGFGIGLGLVAAGSVRCDGAAKPGEGLVWTRTGEPVCTASRRRPR
jgi:serine protease AprX